MTVTAQGQEAERVGEHSRAPAAVEGKGVSLDSSHGMGSKSVGAGDQVESREEGSMAKFWALRCG